MLKLKEYLVALQCKELRWVEEPLTINGDPVDNVVMKNQGWIGQADAIGRC